MAVDTFLLAIAHPKANYAYVPPNSFAKAANSPKAFTVFALFSGEKY